MERRKTQMLKRAPSKRTTRATASSVSSADKPVNPDRLASYNAKRHFEITAEPEGVFEKRRHRSALRFVIQQHDARRMHFDFRLELDGVLKSWAVPKGPSLSPSEKRLAVEVEDHPLDYRRFEGIIPEGQYGGGSVIVWDEGTWLPQGDAHAGLAKGHLAFQLAGQKTNGRFTLVRIKHDRSVNKKTNWLLIKTDDEFARTGAAAEIAVRMPKSIVSGRSVSEIAKAGSPAVWNSEEGRRGARARSKSASVKRADLARKVDRSRLAPPALDELSPQLATLVDVPPSDSGYVYEIKFDGYRALSRLRGADIGIRSRNGLDWTGTFPAITAQLALLDTDAILDGEICAVDAEGKSSFQRLQQAMGTRGGRKVATDASLVYFLFDVLWLQGEDLRKVPLLERKRRLKQLLKTNRSELLIYSEHNTGDLRVGLTQACKLGLEGLIAKKANASYEEARSRSWLKLKCGRRQEFLIVGYLEPVGRRQGFRSLLLGLNEEGALRYVGKVGTGFNEASLKSISAVLKKLKTPKPEVVNPPREKGLHWVKPSLVCEVSFTEMTRDGSLRHPSFQGLREDKMAAEIVRETAVRRKRRSPPDTSSLPSSKAARTSEEKPVVAGIAISHPERVVDDRSGLTKVQLARYYDSAGDWFLRYATDRPMALVRCPEGNAQQCFFQKNAMPGLSKQVQRGKAAGHGILSTRSVAGVVELVQFNAMEFHGWGSSKPALKKPDWIIFDLDPDEALPFATVIDAALEIRDALEQLGLKSFVKTTGGKGLHVTVPIRRQKGWQEVKGFSQQIAEALAAQRPDRYVATMTKAKRVGKIFIDYLRNGEGSTAVLPYSSRARPNAPVAVPVAWKDLKSVEPGEFRVDNVAQWLGRRRTDPWKNFFNTKQSIPELQ